MLYFPDNVHCVYITLSCMQINIKFTHKKVPGVLHVQQTYRAKVYMYSTHLYQLPQYKRNIVESGIKHHKPNKIIYINTNCTDCSINDL